MGAGRGLVSLRLGRSPPPRPRPRLAHRSAHPDALRVVARGRTVPGRSEGAVGASLGPTGSSSGSPEPVQEPWRPPWPQKQS